MTGEHAFQRYNGILIRKKEFFQLIGSLCGRLRVIGPVMADGHAVFKEIASAEDLYMEYKTTMSPPGKTFFYRPKEEILRFELRDVISIKKPPLPEDECLLLGVHPCDINAILYLDRVFSGDIYYQARRKNTILIGLNCSEVSENCFCSSLGTGPHLRAEAGYDVLLTDMQEDYLVEIKSSKAGEILKIEGRKASAEHMEAKGEKGNSLLKGFKKAIDMEGLGELLRENMGHPVWMEVAEEKCLSCSNCVMVCPTCFCHDISDEVEMDMKTVRRFRLWDACQDFKFSAVHGGNFRRTRAARLRQFVMHKLDYEGQFGVRGTVGCGRCITWCPTGIDLTEIAKEIRKTHMQPTR